MAEIRLCEWCSTEIPASALKCPNCKSWRKDINNEKIICYSISGFGGLILGWGLASGAWSTFTRSFSLDTFFSTASGWVAVIFIAASIYYYVKVSKKIGTWWWL